MIEKVLSALREIHDFIVVDGGKISGYIPLEMLSLSDTILLITTLNSPCIANVKTFSSILYESGAFQEEKFKIIINRHQKNDSIALKEAEQQMNKRAFCMIPNDFGTTMEAIHQGKLLSEIGNRKEICRSFERLAFILSADAKPEIIRNGFSGKIDQRGRDKNKLPDPGLNSAY